MTDSQQTKLITILKTTEKAELLQELLLDTADDGYKVKTSLLKSLEKKLPVDLQTGLFSYFQDEKIAVDDNNSLLAEIQNIAAAIRTLPTLSITIAIQPNYSLETFLFETVSKLSETPLLLDIRYNPDIIGGAIIQHNGLYKEYSLEKMLATV